MWEDMCPHYCRMSQVQAKRVLKKAGAGCGYQGHHGQHACFRRHSGKAEGGAWERELELLCPTADFCM